MMALSCGQAGCIGSSKFSPMIDLAFLPRHVVLLCNSYSKLTGRHLLPEGLAPAQRVMALDGLSCAVVSHGLEPDPIFNYANAKALQLFEMDIESFTRLPSRFSAEPMERVARELLLARVSSDGYVDDYSGIRVSATGKRFMVRNATVWNLVDETGKPHGQAALLKEWDYL